MKEAGAVDKLFASASDTKRKIDFLARKAFADQDEVYALAKEFFKVYLDKEYEFTSHELRKELHKVYLPSHIRQELESFIDRLELLEYSPTKYTQKEVKTMLADFKNIVNHLVTEQKKTVPLFTRLLNWMFHKKKKQELTVSEYPAVESQNPAFVDMNRQLENIYLSLNKAKPKKAAKQYAKLVEKYNTLGSTAQHEFYHKLEAAYEEITRQS